MPKSDKDRLLGAAHQLADALRAAKINALTFNSSPANPVSTDTGGWFVELAQWKGRPAIGVSLDRYLKRTSTAFWAGFWSENLKNITELEKALPSELRPAKRLRNKDSIEVDGIYVMREQLPDGLQLRPLLENYSGYEAYFGVYDDSEEFDVKRAAQFICGVVLSTQQEPRTERHSVRSCAELTSPAAVKAAMAESDALGSETFLSQYGFLSARQYIVRFGDTEYDSKAIAAVALGYQSGTSPPLPGGISGGKGSGQAGWALDRLGFQVAGIKHVGWFLEEVERTVDVYFEMLVLHRAGKPFRKIDFLNQLHRQGPKRSTKAYEYKFQNVSAVLRDLKKEWLPGFAPMEQYQKLLKWVVEDRLGRPPEATTSVSKRTSSHEPGSIITKVDWAKRDADNRELGISGERFVLAQERSKLIAANRSDLAADVKWNANEGDGHGYDISSFNVDGTPICIEVKTTALDETAPFFVSSNELAVSRLRGNKYKLYRVYSFFSAPKTFVVDGPLDKSLSLVPASYRAKPTS